jgi:integrase
MQGKSRPASAPRRQAYLNGRGAKEPGIYTIETARDGLVFEIGWRDMDGRQRWRRRVDQTGALLKTITAARAELSKVQAAKGRGERPSDNPRLLFGDVANRWLAEQVPELRRETRTNYRNHVNGHLRPRWGNRRMDAIDATDAAQLVRDLRALGLSEWTISGACRVAGRIFKFARRYCGWQGDNPFALLERGERAHPSTTPERRIYRGDEFAQTLAATTEPWATLFRLASIVGGRESELLGLWWEDLDLSDPVAATIRVGHQIDREGQRVPLKTEESKATLPLPRVAAVMLLEHKARTPAPTGRHSYVFATRDGLPINQRNVLRALYRAQQRARTPEGGPTFPELFEHDERGHLLVDKRGAFVPTKAKRRDLPPLPDFHALRHGAAMDCDDAEEARDLLRHKDSNVTRQIYRAHFDERRRELLRAKLEARHGNAEAFAEATEADRKGSDGHTRQAVVVQIHGVKPNQGVDAA